MAADMVMGQQRAVAVGVLEQRAVPPLIPWQGSQQMAAVLMSPLLVLLLQVVLRLRARTTASCLLALLLMVRAAGVPPAPPTSRPGPAVTLACPRPTLMS